jgi:hypothetical protein
MRLSHPEVEAEDFDLLLDPKVHPLTNTLVPSNNRFVVLVNTVLSFAFLLAVFAFEIRAYILQFQRFEIGDLFVWIMVLLTAFLLIGGTMFVAES